MEARAAARWIIARIVRTRFLAARALFLAREAIRRHRSARARITTVVLTHCCRVALRCVTMQAVCVAVTLGTPLVHAQTAADATASADGEVVEPPLQLIPSRELAPPPRGDAARLRSIV